LLYRAIINEDKKLVSGCPAHNGCFISFFHDFLPELSLYECIPSNYLPINFPRTVSSDKGFW
jgi:hypothetical protein